MTKKVDYLVENHGSVMLLRPRSDDAKNNLLENTSEEAQWFGGALVVEPRYIVTVVTQLREEGWVVE